MNTKIIDGIKYIPVNQAYMLDNKYLRYKIIDTIRTNVAHSDYLKESDCCDPSDLDNFILLLITRMQMTEEPKKLVLVEGESTGGSRDVKYQSLFKFRGKSSNI
jgi:DNA gyrase/topoisomerase IV subunit B